MKNFFALVLSVGIILTCTFSFGQNIPGALSYHEQALMFSSYSYSGSARIQGLGNTQISLGGDISSALSNPAGLGFYNRSELSLTPDVNNFAAKSTYLSNQNTSSQINFNLQSLGAVFNNTKQDIVPGKWRGGSFVISFSKVNNFNNEINYSGTNTNSDIIDFYAEDANIQNVDPDQLDGVTYGAFHTYQMSEFLDAYINGNDTSLVPFYERTFFSEYPTNDFPTRQSETITTSGGQNQWNFSYGANYGDFLYFGATLGIQSLRYNIKKEYTEIYPGISGDIVLQSLLTEYLETKGTGVNGTFGVIARPIDKLTLGFSLITPTYFSLSEYYYFSSEADYNNFSMTNYGNYFDANYDLIATNPNADYTTFYEYDAMLTNQFYEEESTFDYNLTTPMRINAGATFFINKNGFLSADIEYVDYTNMKLKGEQGSLDSDNRSIKNSYQSVVNFRVGAEWRIKSLRVRGGYNYQPSPYQLTDIDRTVQTVSGGLGIRSGKYFVDLAASYKMYTSTYAPYILENPNFQTNYANIENKNLNISMSVGLFF